MFEINVLRAQYILIGLAAGCIAVIMVVLAYLAIWRPRSESASDEGEPSMSGGGGVWRAVPWVLVLTFIGTVGFGIVFAIAKILHPPNW